MPCAGATVVSCPGVFTGTTRWFHEVDCRSLVEIKCLFSEALAVGWNNGQYLSEGIRLETVV